MCLSAWAWHPEGRDSVSLICYSCILDFYFHSSQNDSMYHFLANIPNFLFCPQFCYYIIFLSLWQRPDINNLNGGLILAEVSGRVWHSRGKLISLPTNRNWEEECKKRPGLIPKDAPLLTQFLQAGLPFLLPSPPSNNAIILWTHKPPLLISESSGPKSFLQTPSKTLPRPP